MWASPYGEADLEAPPLVASEGTKVGAQPLAVGMVGSQLETQVVLFFCQGRFQLPCQVRDMMHA